jgi:ubiquinone/menaquinone biosynthesis C-methylase UbiE
MDEGIVASTSGPSRTIPLRISDELMVPQYLEQTYWWAYLHPKGVRFFERQWLVNLILWGNFARLRDSALAEMGAELQGRTLQVACVYGDFTPRLAQRLAKDARLDVIDVAPVQLENLRSKLDGTTEVHLHHQDSTALNFSDGEFDQVILFFLLHEQPDEVRRKTVCEAMRVVKPGGKVIFVDYHRPSLFNPFRYVMIPILYFLEPFALNLWKQDIVSWAVDCCALRQTARSLTCIGRVHQETYFGGLYQKVVLERMQPLPAQHGSDQPAH